MLTEFVFLCRYEGKAVGCECGMQVMHPIIQADSELGAGLACCAASPWAQ